MADRQEIRTAQSSYRQAVENMAEGICLFDADGRLVLSNSKYVSIYGLPERLARPGTAHKDISAYRVDHGLKMVGTLQSFMERHAAITTRVQNGVTLVQTKAGDYISIHHQNLPGGGWVATHRDVTDDLERVVALEDREKQLRRQNSRFEAAVNNMPQGLCMFDAQRLLVIGNVPFARLYGLPDHLMQPGTPLRDIIDHRTRSGLVADGDMQDYLLPPARTSDDAVLRQEFELAGGRAVATACHPMADGGWVATHEDVTDQREQQARIAHLARFDLLTDLPNRLHFAEALADTESRIAMGEKWALLHIDLNEFKSVNDALGHTVGDALLREVADRLRHVRREQDKLARIGGDVFALLAGPLNRLSDAAAIAQRLLDVVGQPMFLEGHSVAIAASVGVAVAPKDGTDAASCLRRADLALHRAKARGRGAYQLFEPEMETASQERQFLERGLRSALSLDQLRLVYQPLIRLEDNAIGAFEALLRWDHPERGMIPPSTFIPVAEETGEMVSIGCWVLREACATAAKWPAHVRVAINLSPVQFKARDLVEHVSAALTESGLASERLELEITESVLLDSTDDVAATLHALKALGVRISMDDFGTGYSSLSYLRSYPFDKIKIDRSFITEVSSRPHSLAIVGAVVGLGRALGMSTTAEGVETRTNSP